MSDLLSEVYECPHCDNRFKGCIWDNLVSLDRKYKILKLGLETIAKLTAVDYYTSKDIIDYAKSMMKDHDK